MRTDCIRRFILLRILAGPRGWRKRRAMNRDGSRLQEGHRLNPPGRPSSTADRHRGNGGRRDHAPSAADDSRDCAASHFNGPAGLRKSSKARTGTSGSRSAASRVKLWPGPISSAQVAPRSPASCRHRRKSSGFQSCSERAVTALSRFPINRPSMPDSTGIRAGFHGARASAAAKAGPASAMNRVCDATRTGSRFTLRAPWPPASVRNGPAPRPARRARHDRHR